MGKLSAEFGDEGNTKVSAYRAYWMGKLDAGSSKLGSRYDWFKSIFDFWGAKRNWAAGSHGAGPDCPGLVTAEALDHCSIVL